MPRPRITFACAVLVSIFGGPWAVRAADLEIYCAFGGKQGTIRMHAGGGLGLDLVQDHYQIKTSLSCPGDTIGWNVLGGDGDRDESIWDPVVAMDAEDRLVATASGPHYSLRRVVEPMGHRIVVTDTLTNTAEADIGIMYRNELVAPTPLQAVRLAGTDQSQIRETSENPSAFCGQATSRLGWLAQDAVYRLQLELRANENDIRMSADHFALQRGASHTFRWVLYPMRAGTDYWTFVNQVRRDWDVNFTVVGQFDYLKLTKVQDLIADHEKLKAYLTRKPLKVIALRPWVDYTNYNYQTGRFTRRDELKVMLRQAMAAIKKVDPEILCIGCIEGNLVTLPPEAEKAVFDAAAPEIQLPRGCKQYPLTAPQMTALRQHKTIWDDCLLFDQEGKCRYELCFYGPEGRQLPQVAVAVYAAKNNGQHRYWLDQSKYLLEEVGVDGVYIDQFNMAFHDPQRYSYDKWDGTTVDIDGKSGQITRRYTDAALVGIEARLDLGRYVLSRGRYMLANTFPATMETQSMRVHRFNESEFVMDVFSWEDGEMPPLFQRPCKGHFSTPIILGARPYRYEDKADPYHAKILVKAAIAYLRHGQLYYHYLTEIPETGPGAGGYGPFNHMFPITPVELRAGAVIGMERIVTCVSDTYEWKLDRKPKVLVFDLYGRAVEPSTEITREPGQWNVDLQLSDWAQIAVIE